MHDSGAHFDMGHPQKFVGAVLHNAYQSRETPSQQAKLPLAFLDHPTRFLIDSSSWEYRDWTTGSDDQTPPDEHFVWLSMDFTPFHTNLGSPYEPPDFTLGLADVKDWLPQVGDPPWILDPAEHPKPVPQAESAGPSSMEESKKRKRKRKKHCWSKKTELKVTTRGQGEDTPIWSRPGSFTSSSSDSQTEGDSGLGSYQQGRDTDATESTARPDHTSRYSPDTLRRLERGGLEDDQEPRTPAGISLAINTVPVPEALLTADPADTDDDKA